MTIKKRLAALEHAHRMEGCIPEILYVNPWLDDATPPTPEELEAHRANVRRVGANPGGFLVTFRDEGGADPLAELLGADDPLVTRHRGPGVTIARSYGMT